MLVLVFVIALLYLALVRDYNHDALYVNQTKGDTETLAGIKKVLLNKITGILLYIQVLLLSQ